MANGTIHKLGTLWYNSSKQARPTKPWYGTNGSASSTGNLLDAYSYASTLAIKDTDSDEAYQLYWREVNIGSSKVLICDRNIACNITWNQLNNVGYCGKMGAGKTITIDGQKYELFMMTGGESSSDTTNQWDQIIGNLGSYSGLPTPTSDDLNNSSKVANFTSTHGAFWNWAGCYSWCAETKTSNGSDYRPLRGSYGARYWDGNSCSGYNSNYGWRPALRVLNTAPTVTSPQSQDYGECKSAFSISITATDSEGDKFDGSIKIDGTEKETFSGTGTASHTLDLSKYWGSLSKAKHTITVTVTDVNNASSTATYTFTKTNSSAAAPTITNLTNGIRRSTDFYVEFTAGADPEGEDQTIVAKIADDEALTTNAKTFSTLEKYNATSSAWTDIEKVASADVGSRFRIHITGQTEGTVKYIGIITTDAGSGTPTQSTVVRVSIGDTLEFTTIPLDRGNTMPKTASVFLDSVIDSGAHVNVYVCNNANDASPAWEACSLGEDHIFTNNSKTASSWAVAAKVIVLAGDATGQISVSAVGLGVL